MSSQKNLFADFKLPIHSWPSHAHKSDSGDLDNGFSDHLAEVSPLETSDEEISDEAIVDNPSKTVSSKGITLDRGRPRARKPAIRHPRARKEAKTIRKPSIKDYSKDQFNAQTRAYLQSAVGKHKPRETLYDEKYEDEVRRLVLSISTGLDVWLQLVQETFPEDVPKIYRLIKRLRRHFDSLLDIGEVNK